MVADPMQRRFCAVSLLAAALAGSVASADILSPIGPNAVTLIAPEPLIAAGNFTLSADFGLVAKIDGTRSDAISVYHMSTGLTLPRVMASPGHVVTRAQFLDARTMILDEIGVSSDARQQRIFDLPSRADRYVGPPVVGRIFEASLTDDLPGFHSEFEGLLMVHDDQTLERVSERRLLGAEWTRDSSYAPAYDFAGSGPVAVFRKYANSDSQPIVYVGDDGTTTTLSWGLDDYVKGVHLSEEPEVLFAAERLLVTTLTFVPESQRAFDALGFADFLSVLRVRDMVSGRILHEVDETVADLTLKSGYLLADGILAYGPPSNARTSRDGPSQSLDPQELMLVDLQSGQTRALALPAVLREHWQAPDGGVGLFLDDGSIHHVSRASADLTTIFAAKAAPAFSGSTLTWQSDTRLRRLGRFADGSYAEYDFNFATMTAEPVSGPWRGRAWQIADDGKSAHFGFALQDGSMVLDDRSGAAFLLRRSPDGKTERDPDLRALQGLFSRSGRYATAFNAAGRLCVLDGETGICTEVTGGHLGGLRSLAPGEDVISWNREARLDLRFNATETTIAHGRLPLGADASGQWRHREEIHDIKTGALSGEGRVPRACFQAFIDLQGQNAFCLTGSSPPLASVSKATGEALTYGSLSSEGGWTVIENPEFDLAALLTFRGYDLVDMRSLKLRATLTVTTPDDWLLITPEGFYAAAGDGATNLQILRGMDDVWTIDRFRETLYRPDLVFEALQGDPEGLVEKAAATVSLERILLSGPPPTTSITVDLDGAEAIATALTVDDGGGIGRVEWRVNGVTQVRDVLSTRLKLAEGENRITFIAYNADNTMHTQAEPVVLTVRPDVLPEPRLFVLTVGVDDYALDPLDLKFAVRDAQMVGAALAQAGQLQYGSVEVVNLTNAQATFAGLQKGFSDLQSRIGPNDVFVFFFAGHGKTLDGRFYVIPPDFSGTTLASVQEQGIGQSTWQDWFAAIPAQRSLILFDSCESGSLADPFTSRELRYRAANDALGNATGRALLTASTGTGVALEGYQDHGIFTYAILQALKTADKDGDGLISIEELSEEIRQSVPRIAAEYFGERQVPEYSSPAQDFVLVPTGQ